MVPRGLNRVQIRVPLIVTVSHIRRGLRQGCVHWGQRNLRDSFVQPVVILWSCLKFLLSLQVLNLRPIFLDDNARPLVHHDVATVGIMSSNASVRWLITLHRALLGIVVWTFVLRLPCVITLADLSQFVICVGFQTLRIDVRHRLALSLLERNLVFLGQALQSFHRGIILLKRVFWFGKPFC